MLDRIPLEILGQIQQNLSRRDVHQISATSKHLYSAIIPFLYTHLELGYLTHIRQLQQGLDNNPFLRNAISQNTKHLTLRSKQNGNRWRVQDLLKIIGAQTQIELLTFCDCPAITTTSIHEIVSILPRVRHVEFKYCHIIYASTFQASTSRSVAYLGLLKDSLGYKNRYEITTKHSNQPSNLNNPLLQRVSYIWTDFTEKSIVPSLFSQITHLELGSNRNKYESVNGIMVHAIPQYCPAITHLIITVPAISEETLCNTILAFGQQLQLLSIRCDGSQTLSTVATYATKLQSLFIRITPAAEKEDMNVPLLGVIENCLDLEKLEISSRQLDKDVPNMMWESIIACADKNFAGKNNAKVSRAREAIAKKLQMVLEDDDLKLREQQPPSPRRMNSIWFHSVTEEALEQRHIYNSSNRIQHNNAIETFFMDKVELLQAKQHIESTRNEVPIEVSDALERQF
jgi:hypothetical protein